MRLLFSISFYTPYVSGLTLYVKKLAEELVKKGYDCSVLTNQHVSDLVSNEEINKVRVIRAKPLFKISKGFFSFDFVVESFWEVSKSKIVFINLPQFEGFILALFARIFGKKIIAIYHCEVILPKSFFNFLVENCLNLSNFLTLLFADRVITYTEDFASHSKILQHFRKKVQVVYPPMNSPKIDNRVQKVLQQKIGKNSEILIGVAARLAAEKGVEYLLETIPLLNSKLKDTKYKNFKMVMAGSLNPVGEEKYREKIFKLVEKYKDHIIFLDELKEEDMGSFYSLLNILVLPSINSTEAFGMVQVEAMMVGIPVVATDLPGVRVPILKTGMGKIVPIKDSEKLADAIFQIISNKNKYVKKSSQIEAEFSLDKTIKFYINMINNYE